MTLFATNKSVLKTLLTILSFPLPSWCAVRSYRPHLEEKDSIWGDDWSHSPFIRWSPSWGFPGFSSAARQMPRDLCIAPGINSLSPLSLATDVSDAILGASGLCLGTRTGAGGTATLTKSYFGRSPWPHGQQASFKNSFLNLYIVCCERFVILPTSFGGKGTHLRWWLVTQSLHQTVS